MTAAIRRDELMSPELKHVLGTAAALLLIVAAQAVAAWRARRMR